MANVRMDRVHNTGNIFTVLLNCFFDEEHKELLRPHIEALTDSLECIYERVGTRRGNIPNGALVPRDVGERYKQFARKVEDISRDQFAANAFSGYRSAAS